MSVKKRITAAFGILVLFVIGVVSSINYFSFKESSSLNYKNKLRVEAELLTKAVQQHMGRIFDVLNVAADNLSYSDKGEFLIQENLIVLNSVFKNLDVINSYSAISSGETFSTSTNGIVPGFNAKSKNREWFTRAFDGEEFILTRPYKSAEGDSVMAAAVPIRRAGTVVGVICVNLEVSKITEYINSLLDEHDFYIANADGYVIASVSEADIGGNIYSIVPDFLVHKESTEAYYEHKEEQYFFASDIMDTLGWKTWTWAKIEKINEDSNIAFKTSFIAGFFLLSTALFIVYLIVVRLVYKPVGGEPEQIEHMVKEISSGNLSLNTTEDDSGSVTGIYQKVLTMTKNLRKMVSRIDRTSSLLHETSLEITSTVDIVTKSSETQMNQLEMTSAAISEMTATIQDVAEHAQGAANAASKASDNSELGITVINEVNSNVTTLRSGIVNVQESILKLADETKNIGKILEVIQGVAEQTNLLALNAAIEAARAGTQGRGFAVVADEVRNLASRTHANTNEIQDLIHRLQTQAEDSVKLMDENSKYVEATYEKSSMANTTLTEIFESMTEISDMNSQIAAAAEQQSAVASEISSSIIQINDLAGKTFEQAKLNAGKSEELQATSKDLALIVDEFKL